MFQVVPNYQEENDSFPKKAIPPEETITEEIVVALCGPIGSDIHGVAIKLKEIFKSVFHYDAEIITLSTFIKDFGVEPDELPDKQGFERKDVLINKGDELRKKHGDSILAELAIAKMNKDRILAQKEGERFTSRRICYIIDSIKNQKELDKLKFVYRDLLYFIGVFSPLNIRIENLEKSMKKSDVYRLIDKDSGEEKKTSQTVKDTFPLADFFLRIDNHDEMEIKLTRFIHLIFGTKIITPTPDETAMYLAASAAGNSACLSRQVGAALTDSEGELISVGWNDVPKYGGDLYKTDFKGIKQDHRCFKDGQYCRSDEQKDFLSEHLVELLIDEKLIVKDNRDKAIHAIRNSKIKAIVEFSRSIHAEMHAIILGCQVSGEKVKNGKLYITTYPCHNCARHIIVAGIKEVYYIEPYRKSLTMVLHSDSITEDDSGDKVKIIMFDGIAPNRYLQFFKMYDKDSRKDKKGKLISNPTYATSPKYTLSLEAIPTLEAQITKLLADKKEFENLLKNE